MKSLKRNLKLLLFLVSLFLFVNLTETFTQIQEVVSVGMTVSEMNRSIEFYSEVLGFEKISDIEVHGTQYEHLQGVFGLRLRIVELKLGNEILELTEYLTPKGEPIPSDSKSNDLWFQHIAVVVSNMEKAYQHLRKYAVKHISPAPQKIPEWNEAAAGIEAFYFQDPDHHNLEIIYFPPGKGDAKWQQKSENLFLGIDHTAIVISQTKKSLELYKDILGLEIWGKSENYGIEQERLNNVFGVRLRITALKVDNKTPGIEFLEYITPSNGRKFPNNAKSNDILHWQTTLLVENLEILAEKLVSGDYKFISTYIVALPEDWEAFKKAVLLRDSDGHALRLISR